MRSRLGVGLNADYEHAMLCLLAGEGGRVRIEREEARLALVKEAAEPYPFVGLFRKFAAHTVRIRDRPGPGLSTEREPRAPDPPIPPAPAADTNAGTAEAAPPPPVRLHREPEESAPDPALAEPAADPTLAEPAADPTPPEPAPDPAPDFGPAADVRRTTDPGLVDTADPAARSSDAAGLGAPGECAFTAHRCRQAGACATVRSAARTSVSVRVRGATRCWSRSGGSASTAATTRVAPGERLGQRPAARSLHVRDPLRLTLHRGGSIFARASAGDRETDSRGCPPA